MCTYKNSASLTLGMGKYVMKRYTNEDFDAFVPVCYRGAGFNDQFQPFFVAGKKFRVPSFVATSVLKDKALWFTRRAKPPLSKMFWEIQFDPRGEFDPIYRCKHGECGIDLTV